MAEGEDEEFASMPQLPRRKKSTFELGPPPGSLVSDPENGAVGRRSEAEAVENAASQDVLSSMQSRERRMRSSQANDAMAMLWNNLDVRRLSQTDARRFSTLDARRMSQVVGTQWSNEEVQPKGGPLRSFIGPIQGEHFPYTNTYVIHPNSACAAIIFLTSGVLLIYSAVQLPLDIGFSWEQELCDVNRTLLRFNIFVDTFFCFEIIITFFVGVLHEGSYVDDLPTIAWLYIKSRFMFDCVTSLPTSWIEYSALSKCGSDKEGESDAVLENLRLFRLLKPLRLVKLLRFFKFAKIFTILDGLLRISPNVIRLSKLLFGLCLLVNLVACIYWLLKSSFDDDFEGFMDAKGVSKDSMADKWILAVYFINTVFTTVGFGDIDGDNDIERAFCIVIMWVGTGIFATLVNGLQEVGMELNEKNREKNQYVQKVVKWLRKKKCPAWVEHEVSAWLRFKFDHDKASTERTEVLEVLPPQLQLSMVMHLNGMLINQTWVFGQLEHAEAGRFVQEMSLAMRFEIYNADEVIASHETQCDKLCIVWAGHVSVQVLEEEACKEVAVLKKGDCFGEFSLLGDTSWGATFGEEVEFWTPEHTELAVISVKDFQDIMTHFPKELYEEVKALAYAPLGGDVTRLKMEARFKEKRETFASTKLQRNLERWEKIFIAALLRLRAESHKRMQSVLANFAAPSSISPSAKADGGGVSPRPSRGRAARDDGHVNVADVIHDVCELLEGDGDGDGDGERSNLLFRHDSWAQWSRSRRGLMPRGDSDDALEGGEEVAPVGTEQGDARGIARWASFRAEDVRPPAHALAGAGSQAASESEPAAGPGPLLPVPARSSETTVISEEASREGAAAAATLPGPDAAAAAAGEYQSIQVPVGGYEPARDQVAAALAGPGEPSESESLARSYWPEAAAAAAALEAEGGADRSIRLYDMQADLEVGEC